MNKCFFIGGCVTIIFPIFIYFLVLGFSHTYNVSNFVAFLSIMPLSIIGFIGVIAINISIIKYVSDKNKKS